MQPITPWPKPDDEAAPRPSVVGSTPRPFDPPHATVSGDRRGGDSAIPAEFLAEGPPMYLTDSARRLVFVSPALTRLALELFDVNHAGLEMATPPDALLRVFDLVDEAPEHEVQLTHRLEIGGAPRVFRARHYRLTRNGEPAYAGVYSDVTSEAGQRQRAAMTEARHRDLLRATADWTWETDANLNLLSVSPGIVEAVDELPAALAGRNLFAIGRFTDVEDSTRSQQELRTQQVPFRGRLFMVRGRHGGERLVSLSAVPVFDEATGRFTGYRGTGTDVTSQQAVIERARTQRDTLKASVDELRDRNLHLDVALNEARALNEAKTEFLGKMSHELRTPLNAIIGFSEMGTREVFGSLNERYLGYFKDIGSAASHLLSIINDILDAVSLDAGHVAVESRPVRISKVIAEARSLIMMRAEQKGVDLTAVDLARDFQVVADTGRTRQIFLNLLSNAVKCTGPGGRVGIEARQYGMDKVAVTVWDTGIGIPADQHERIFESFHQVPSTLTPRPHEGTGLGLSVSRQLARLMGGDITVDSSPGQGARFTVTLPLASDVGTGLG